MKRILLFGAGKSATSLIQYLLKNAEAENWTVTVVDADISLVQSKLGVSLHGNAVSFDVMNEEIRKKHIKNCDIVISLLPPTLHLVVAKDCIEFKKNLLTASYVDAEMKRLENLIMENDLLFLCEMGLDPGIDHMSAKKIIDEIHSDGGNITSFLSHCGGLVAPESDDNPWRYKISWNPRNVVLAGKAGAVFQENGSKKHIAYAELFKEKRFVIVPHSDSLCWYPNRDSTGYMSIYDLHDCPTFIRTTLRHPDFIYGWQNLIDLKLTDENPIYETNGLSLKDFFKQHMELHGFEEWLQQRMQEQLSASKKILENLMNIVDMESAQDEKDESHIEEFMVVNDKGNLQEVDVEDLKINVAAMVADKIHETKLTLKQLFYLGMDDDTTLINKGKCSAAEVLQFILETKLPLSPADKDMVVMVHEIEYTKNEVKYLKRSSLVLTGMDAQHTAMAKTVGLPLGIAAKLVLNGTIQSKGLCIPVIANIYEPVLDALTSEGIVFIEEDILLS